MGKRRAQGQTRRKISITSRNRKLGFRARMSTVGGRRVIKNRRAKGRVRLTITNETGSGATKNKKLRRRR